MTNYQLLTNDNNLTLIFNLIRNKIDISTTTIRNLSIYDRFYHLDGTKKEKYNQIGFEFRLTPDTVRKIINKLNRNAR